MSPVPWIEGAVLVYYFYLSLGSAVVSCLGLVAGWIYVMIVSIRELSTSILLYSPGNEVISIVIWELWENGQYVELSALSVLFILLLLVLVGIAQMAGKRFGVKDS